MYFSLCNLINSMYIPQLGQIILPVIQNTAGICIRSPSSSFSKLVPGTEPLLTLLTWRILWTPTNASKWQMGFNSVFKGLNSLIPLYKSLIFLFLLFVSSSLIWYIKHSHLLFLISQCNSYNLKILNILHQTLVYVTPVCNDLDPL